MSETRRSNVIVITGTDTSVGKTWVGIALARALTAGGLVVRAIKAVETGCGDATHDAEDGVQLARATGQSQPTEALYRYRDPVAPALAAEREGRPVDFDDLLLAVEAHARECDLVLLEGSGGLLAPITWEWCLVDVAQALDARAIVVAADRQGTLNHTVLTLGALELAAIPVTDVLLTPPEAADASTGTNASAIQRLTGFPRVSVVPRTTDETGATSAMAEVARRIAELSAAPAA